VDPATDLIRLFLEGTAVTVLKTCFNVRTMEFYPRSGRVSYDSLHKQPVLTDSAL